MPEQQIDYEQAESLGISREAYDEVLDIVGCIPTMEQLSTLLAMWEGNGRQQSLCGWLRGQRHTVQRNEYLYHGLADHLAIREPKIKECRDIALQMAHGGATAEPCGAEERPEELLQTGLLLYMVGNVSSEFVDSEYARRCLHLVDQPMAAGGHEEDCQYIELILGALHENGMLIDRQPVAAGGLFGSLLRWLAPLGFDVLAPREVRLDAFLFGEEAGRYLVAVEEAGDDLFLLKMDDARLNCCFLGRSTKNRIVVDGYDFGPVRDFCNF